MREIKFRVWDDVLKRMLPNYGNFIDTDGGVWEDARTKYDTPNKEIEWINDKVVLMQYTGLKDKNGKEIYEGDIVHGFETNGGETFSYEVKYDPADDYTWNFPTGLCNQCEIIGNIYENPGLFKEE